MVLLISILYRRSDIKKFYRRSIRYIGIYIWKFFRRSDIYIKKYIEVLQKIRYIEIYTSLGGPSALGHCCSVCRWNIHFSRAGAVANLCALAFLPAEFVSLDFPTRRSTLSHPISKLTAPWCYIRLRLCVFRYSSIPDICRIFHILDMWRQICHVEKFQIYIPGSGEQMSIHSGLHGFRNLQIILNFLKHFLEWKNSQPEYLTTVNSAMC